jgi:hypothetical protein
MISFKHRAGDEKEQLTFQLRVIYFFSYTPPILQKVLTECPDVTKSTLLFPLKGLYNSLV